MLAGAGARLRGVSTRNRQPTPDAQPPPDAGSAADEGAAVAAFLCIFLCELAVAGAMVLAPDAPETVSVEPLEFGLLIPVPPCPPAAPPPAPWAKTLPDVPNRSTEIKIPFVATRMVVSSNINRSTPNGANPYVRDRNSHTVRWSKQRRAYRPTGTSVANWQKNRCWTRTIPNLLRVLEILYCY